jgi:hypothetical protein
MKTRLCDPVEILYVALMYRWEKNAPPDRHAGFLDGEPARNTQIARLVDVLNKIAAGNDERTFSTLAQHSRRNDGRSYISKDKSWMEQPCPLSAGWFFEGCTSLIQKQEIIRQFTKLGLSPAFAACVDDFVAGRTIVDYFPTEAEDREILAKIQASEAADEA